jgi:hypothetical protein
MRRGAKEGGEGEPAGLGIEGQGDRNGHPEGNLFERSLGSIVKVNRLSHLQGLKWFRAKVGINLGGFGIRQVKMGVWENNNYCVDKDSKRESTSAILKVVRLCW